MSIKFEKFHRGIRRKFKDLEIGEEFIDFCGDAPFDEIEQLMLVYRELAESSEYEDRLRAEGFIKALEVLI